jgi:hypothetical protein
MGFSLQCSSIAATCLDKRSGTLSEDHQISTALFHKISAGKFPGARIGEDLIQRNVAGGEGGVARLPVSLP